MGEFFLECTSIHLLDLIPFSTWFVFAYDTFCWSILLPLFIQSSRILSFNVLKITFFSRVFNFCLTNKHTQIHAHAKSKKWKQDNVFSNDSRLIEFKRWISLLEQRFKHVQYFNKKKFPSFIENIHEQLLFTLFHRNTPSIVISIANKETH